MDSQLAIIFAQKRSRCELELVRAILAAPDLGMRIASDLGITPKHFQNNYDARLIFCACEVAAHLGREKVVRLARMALEQDHEPLAGGLETFANEWAGAHQVFCSIAVLLTGKKLIQLSGIERDARAHLRYAEQLIRNGVAA